MRRLLLWLAALVLVVPGLPADARARPYLTDRTGDANLLNDQKLGLPLPTTSSPPASLGQADIVSVTLTTMFSGEGRHRRPAGTSVTMRLASAPTDGVMYEVLADWRGTCDGLRSSLSLYLMMDREITTAQGTCQDADGGSSNDVLRDYSVDPTARTVTWRTRATMPRGAQIVSVQADTCVFVVGVFDEAVAGGSWVYGR